MPIIARAKPLVFTRHARAKMAFYKLSESRVRHVLHTPKRVEEGVAPKTVAAMAPSALKKVFGKSGDPKALTGGPKEVWSQEIWVMFQDSPRERKIISAWRYPGMTKPRSAVAKAMVRQEFVDFRQSSLQ